MVSVETWRVAQCGLGLCLILFAFLAMSSIEETTLKDMSEQDPSISPKAGYYSQTIIYGAFVISNLIAPPIVAIIGCRWSLVVGSVGYTIFMSQFLYLSNWTLYAGSALEGFAAGLMWTASGYYMALNSNETTVGRNSAILWMLSMTANILGGIYLLIMFSVNDASQITESLANILYGTFCGVAFVGNVVFLFTRSTPKEVEMRELKRANYLKELVGTFRLLFTWKMAFLAVPYAYTGLHTSFWSAVYPTSLSFTSNFPLSSKIVLGMNNLAVGVGGAAGCILFIYIDRYVAKVGRYMVISIGGLLNCFALLLIGLNLPIDAPFEQTTGSSIIPPSPWIACLSGFILGIVDSCFNTQLYAITSSIYQENCAQAMALFKFYHALLSTVSMFYGGLLILPGQLAILATFTVASAVCFAVVEIPIRRRIRLEDLGIQPRTVSQHREESIKDLNE
ncbi:hypothetical protein PRIPAC_71233 [Pristionchus pacificus]|uniref:UNC93-like protein MFSD11 n=1 Tax=Pristionchus pacificus TaxID=54126 RepID=A0A2A6BG01_PRIPA|nr:hypothetical protein PRIPAC_71233 [Pristionchus pacificus]|eukprot:PDM64845.1 membrane transporter [Pristionchus pacificus]